MLFAWNSQSATISSTGTGGNWSDPATWNPAQVPGESDQVTIVAGATVVIDADVAGLTSLSISGTLLYETETPRTLSSAMITVNSGGKFLSPRAGSVKTHQLIAQGSIINNGIIDFSSSSNNTGVEIVFTGSGNAIFNCTDARLTNLQQTNGIILNKGNSAASVLSFIPGNVFKVLSDGGSTAKGFLKIVGGTFNIIGSNSFSNPVFNTEGDYTIPAAGGFWLGNQNATVTAHDGNFFIHGDFKITNGVFNAGLTGKNVLETNNGGHFKISGGTLNVVGKFNVDKGSCSISGGKVNLAMSENTANSEPTFNISAQANLEIFGNAFISFAYPNSQATPANDIQIHEGSGLKRINGGVVQLGTEVTPAGSTFLVAGNRIINILKVLKVCDIKVLNTSKSDISSVSINSLPLVVFDKEAPLCTEPPKITLKCGEALPQKYASLEEFIQAGGEASDNCTLMPSSFKFVGQVQSNAYCPYTITRTYSLSDASGNISLIRQQFVIERDDTKGPTPQPEAIAENTGTQEIKLKSAQVTFTAVKNGNWNDPTTWGTASVPTSADDVNTAGFTVTVDAAAACNSITIDAGGTLNYSGGNTLQVYGNWTNNGTYNGGTNGIVEFTGANPATINGTTNFEELKITKGSLNATLTIGGATTVTSGGSLLMNSGLITIPAGGSFTVNPSSALNIPITSGFDLTGGNLTTGNFTVTNEGLIRISSGTANFGNSSGNSVHTQVDGAFIVSGGTVNVAGRLESSASGTLAPLGVTSGISISGGNVTLATVGNGLTNVGSLNVTPAGTFSFTNGTIVFQNESTATTAIDLGLVGGSGAKTTVGGTFQFGNGSTPAGTIFNISSEILLNRVTSSANADLKLINDVTIGQWLLDPNTSVDLNGNEIQLAVASTGTYNFPLDNGSGVSIPVSIQLTSGTFAPGAYIKLESFGSKYAGNESDVNFLNRYWTVTTSGITSPSYNITATYADADIAGTETEIAMGSWTGTLPWVKNADVNSGANTISVNNITASTFTFTGITSDPPTVSITASPATICAGASSNLTAIPVGDAPFTYSWSPATGLSSTSIANPVATPGSTTSYTVVVTDGNGFTASDVVSVTVNPIPTATAPANQSYCNGVATAAISLTGSPSGVTFDISGGAAIGLSDQTGITSIPSFTPTTGSATVTITPKANGCTGNDVTYTITVNPTPTATAPASQSYCNGVATAAISLTGSPSGVTFDISGGAAVGLSDQTGITTIPSFTPTTGSATVTITPKANGCTGSAVTYTITVNPTPTLSSAAQAAAVCEGNSASIDLGGLIPNSTFTVSYTINGVVQTAITGLTANGSGNASFTTAVLTAANNGQTLQITGITVTSATPNCTQSFTQNVTLSVNSIPVITTCPAAAINLSASIGACSAVGNYTVMATGTPAPAYTYTFTGATIKSGSGTGDGELFNSGITNVKVTATNACGSVDCNFTVSVADNSAPVFSDCPANITVNTGAGSTTCDKSATWTEPTAVDNCSPSVSLTWTKNYLPGAIFPVGTTTVTYTVKDLANNTATCSFTVTVVDDTAPTFTSPSAVTIYTNATCVASTVPAITGTVTVKSDNCTPSANLIVGFTDGPNVPGACSGTYSFTRTWTVTDLSTNSTTGTQVITVADNTKPVITVPADIAISCSASILPATTGQATAIDNCDGVLPPSSITYTDATVPGSCAGNSTITRTWTATDCSGNFSTATQTINISDNQAPIASISGKTAPCPTSIPVAYATLAAFLADGGTATDNCGTLTLTLYDEIANGLDNKPGYCPSDITRVYRITDQCGNYTDVVQSILIQGECGCAKCTSQNAFEEIDLRGQPDGSITVTVIRADKCCGASKRNDWCASFNVILDEDAVGVEILIDGGPTPPGQSWKKDCVEISGGGVVCLPSGVFHLFTFCKDGVGAPQLTNTYTFRSVRGAVVSSDLSTRVDCNGTLHVEGISSPVWNSISPGTPGQYNSYLNLADPYNPVFVAPVGAPPVIQYEVCGTFGSVICDNNSVTQDCDIVTVNVKEKIEMTLNINTNLTCINDPLNLVANISPAGNYTYEWFAGPDATGTKFASTTKNLTVPAPVPLGTYSLRVTDVDAAGIPCSTQTFNFTVSIDGDGPAVFSPPSGDLTINCNDPNANTLIQNWLTSATATDESGNPIPVSNNYTGITMACGTVLPITFSASDHCLNVGTATANIRIIDTVAPTWTTAAGALDRIISCSDAAGLAAAQALIPSAIDNCDVSPVLTKISGNATPGSCANSASYTNTWTAKDACNNTSSIYTQTITIIDNTPPVITTQAQNLSVSCDGSGNVADLNNWLTNHAGAVATDACGAVSWAHNYTALTPACGATGSATVVFTVTDACGNSATTQATFTITDTTPPAITGTLNPITVQGCTIAVLPTAYTTVAQLEAQGITVTDGCTADASLVVTSSDAAPTGTSPLNVVRTYTITDACNNSTTVTQTIQIQDITLPTITCPANVIQSALPGTCFLANVVIPDPVTADNCGVVLQTWSILKPDGSTVNSPATGINSVSGQTFDVGVSTVTYTIADAAGNTATCSFTVTILDVTPPVVGIGGCTNISESAAPNNCSKIPATLNNPTYSDNCWPVAQLTLTYTMAGATTGTGSGSVVGQTFNVGVTTVTYKVTDPDGNFAECSFTVTILDVTPPNIAIGGCTDVSESAAPNNCSKIPVTIINPTYSDNCWPVAQLTLTYTMTGATTGSGSGSVVGQTFNVGVTTVTYKVTDPDGNFAECSFTVTILDVTPPNIAIGSCTNVSESAAPNDCSKIPTTILPPTYSDNCWPVAQLTLTYTMTGATTGTGAGSVVGLTFNVGVTTVTYKVTDPDGNFAECSFTVTILDVTPPNIAIGGCTDVSETTLANNCSKVPINILPPTYSDNCWPVAQLTLTYTLTGATTGTGNGSVVGLTFNAGLTTVTYKVTDPDGNFAECSFTVTIIPLTPPAFTVGCPPNPAPVTVTPGNCDAYVSIPIPAVTDPCAIGYTLVNNFNNTNNASGTYPLGSTTVIWTITPTVGTPITCNQIVIVNDLPLACPANITVPADLGQNYASNVVVPPPTFSNCSGLTLIWTMVLPDASTTASPLTGINVVSSPGTFYVGVTTITYTLTHADGTKESCSFTITVTSQPDITCQPPIVHDADPGECNYSVNPGVPTLVEGAQPITWTWVIDGPGTPGEATGTFVGSVGTPGPPNIGVYDFKVGTSTITWTATNISGSDACTQTVTVTDTEKPTLVLPTPFSECVLSIISAVYEPTTTDITPARPDYYSFITGDTRLDLDPTKFADNCLLNCPPIAIRWQIDFFGGTPASISGTGQPSTHASFQIPGDGVTFNDMIHTITYWITDCSGNESLPVSQNITVKPRPNVIKMP